MDENQVKIALERYHTFKSHLKKCEGKLEEIAVKKYKMPGSIIKMPEGSPVSKESRLLDLLEKEEPLVKDYRMNKYFIELADFFISTLPKEEQSMVRDRYINRKSCTWLETHHFMSDMGQRKLINRRIKQFIEKT